MMYKKIFFFQYTYAFTLRKTKTISFIKNQRNTAKTSLYIILNSNFALLTVKAEVK